MTSTRQLNLAQGAWNIDLNHPITDEYPTTGSGMWLGASPLLFGPPPTIIDERPAAGAAGTNMSPTRHGARDIVVPISVQVPASPTKLEEVLATLSTSIDALAGGLVRLTYTRGDASTPRWIDAYHTGTSPIEIRYDGDKTAQVRVAFRAPDPYWSDGADRTTTITSFVDRTGSIYDFSGSTGFNAAEAFSSDDLSLNQTITVTGDMPAAAYVEIDGPFDDAAVIMSEVDAVAENRWWRYDAAVADGSTLIVNSRPRDLAVTVDGVNQWSNLDGPNRVLELPVGDVDLRVQARNPGGNTEARVSWRPRWLTC